MAELYSVKLTEQAQGQLKEIIRYISANLQSKATALKMMDALEKEILSLNEFPNQIALTEEEPWHSQGIHKMPVKNYLVYFWVNEQTRTVQVTAIAYGRREQKQLLAHMNME